MACRPNKVDTIPAMLIQQPLSRFRSTSFFLIRGMSACGPACTQNTPFSSMLQELPIQGSGLLASGLFGHGLLEIAAADHAQFWSITYLSIVPAVFQLCILHRK